MVTFESVRESVQAAQAVTEGNTAWSDAARLMWLGYVAALVQVGVLVANDAFRIIEEDLKATVPEREYMLRLLDTNLGTAAPSPATQEERS